MKKSIIVYVIAGVVLANVSCGKSDGDKGYVEPAHPIDLTVKQS